MKKRKMIFNLSAAIVITTIGLGSLDSKAITIGRETSIAGIGKVVNTIAIKKSDVDIVKLLADNKINKKIDNKNIEILEEIKSDKDNDEEDETSKEESDFEYKFDKEDLVIADIANDGYVNIRSQAGSEGEIIGKLYDGSVGKVVGKEENWYQIESGAVTGYVSGDVVVSGDEAIARAEEIAKKYAVVNTETLMVREEASIDSKILTLVSIDTAHDVIEANSDWTKIELEDSEGFVKTEFIDLILDNKKAVSVAEEESREKAIHDYEEVAQQEGNGRVVVSEPVQESQQIQEKPVQPQVEAPAPVAVGSNSVVSAAYGLIGQVSYVYGGNPATNATDCSGFVQKAYANAGINIGRNTYAQRDQSVPVSDPQPGDLVFYNGYSHVGIYVGNGVIIDNMNPQYPVNERSLTLPGSIDGYRRVVG